MPADTPEVEEALECVTVKWCQKETFCDHPKVLAAEVRRLRALLSESQAKVDGLEKALEEMRVLAERYQFDTGAIARGVVQQLRGMAEKALSRPAAGKEGDRG